MTELWMTADDFTGALDSGVQLAKAGLAVRVALDGGLRENANGAAVRVADTQSRHLPPEEAKERVRAQMAAAAKAGVPVLYKKTDSTLRGNLGAEFEGALAGSGRQKLVFVPAYPALGRIVIGGRAYLNGQPLEKTALAQDPLNPVTTGVVADVVRAQTGLPVRAIVPAALEEELEREGPGVFCVDAATEEDLAHAAQALAPWAEHVVLAGCAGFAAHLPGFLRAPRQAFAPVGAQKRLLAVCGSVNPVSLGQVAFAEAQGAAVCRLTPEELLAPSFLKTQAGKASVQALACALEQAGWAVLCSARSGGHVEAVRALAAAQGLPEGGAHLAVAGRLAEVAAAAFAGQRDCALAVFGGDTLFALAQALGVAAIEPLGELSPGVVLSRAQGALGGFTLVSKAGGFGGEDVLCSIRQALLNGVSPLPC